MRSDEPASPPPAARPGAAGWRLERAQLTLLRRLLQREAHVLLSQPQAAASHLHNMLVLEEGEEEAAAPLLERARLALAGRTWLQLAQRPPLDRSVQRGGLVHGATVWALAWSPDGSLLASAGADGVVRVWRPERGLLVGTLEAQAGPVNALHWSPDGKVLASGHDDGTVHLWQAGDLRQLDPLPAADGVLALAWSPDGELLAVGCADGSVALWTMGTRRCREAAVRHTGRVHALAWSPEASSLASGSASGEVWIRDRDTAAVRKRLEDRDLQEQLSTLLHGEEAAERVHHAATVFALAWSPDSQTLAATRRIGALSLWRTASGEIVGRTIVDGGATAVAWSPDGVLLTYCAGQGLIYLVEPGKTPSRTLPVGHGAAVWSLAWAPHGELLASGGEDGTVRLWEARRWWHRAPAASPEAQGHGSTVLHLSWSGDGSILASGGAEGAVCLWNASTGKLEAEAGNLGGPPAAITPAPGQGVLLAPMMLKTEVPLLHWPGPEEPPRHLFDVSGPALALALSPVGSLLAVGDLTGTVWIYQMLGEQIRAVFSPPRRAEPAGAEPRPSPVWALSWARGGRLLAVAGQLGTVIWDLQTDQPLSELEGTGGAPVPTAADLGLDDDGTLALGIVPAALSWSPDGKLLAASVESKTIRLWAPDRSRAVMELAGHERPVTALAWSPDARFLASASHDLTVRIWEVADGTSRAVAHCLSSPSALRFARGGVLQVADDGTATGNRPLLYRFVLRGFDG